VAWFTPEDFLNKEEMTMRTKSLTDNYDPMGKGSNSTDNKKDGPIDSKIKKAKEKKNIGVIGGYKHLTRKNDII
tara:strand:+ start:734 stop:955 length:222 start_codon:yes stop_codon:yes gene_type:complete